MDEYLLVMAEAHASSELEASVRRARAQLPKQPPDFDGLCVECGDEIPAPRIKFGAIKCLECQQLFEIRSRQMRKE